MKKVLLVLLGFVALTVSAQDSTLSVKGFVDAYYGYNFAEPKGNERPSYLYNHTRHNEISLNLALIQLNYEADKTRGCQFIIATHCLPLIESQEKVYSMEHKKWLTPSEFVELQKEI